MTRQAAVGDVFTVTNTNDAGPGSLRQAIVDAGTGGTIQFDASLAGQTISLASTLSVENATLIIEGPQSGGIILDGGGQIRVLHVKAGTAPAVTDVTLLNVTVVGGTGALGGGILNSGDLTVVNSTISSNTAESSGGGIYHDGSLLTLINATIAFNSGGGILASNPSGEVTMRNSIIASNDQNCGLSSGVTVTYEGLNLSSDASC